MLNELSSWFNDLSESFAMMGARLSVSKVEIELILTKAEELRAYKKATEIV